MIATAPAPAPETASATATAPETASAQASASATATAPATAPAQAINILTKQNTEGVFMKDSMQSFIEETIKKNIGDTEEYSISCDDFYPLYEKLFVQVQSKFKPKIMPLVFTVLSSWLFGEAMAMIDEGKRNKLMDTFFMMLERHESIWRKHNR